MAVYVTLNEQDVQKFIARYDIGNLTNFEPIAQGVSNSNFLIKTDRDQFILTLFEESRTRADDLPFIFSYARHLGKKGIICPDVIPDRNQHDIQTFKGKPAVLIGFLKGKDIPRPETQPVHCTAIGAYLANMHNAVSDFDSNRDNDWPLERMERIFEVYEDSIKDYDPELADIISTEFQYLKNETAKWTETLPTGAVHCDLFPDNVFFLEDDISAVIDLYFACTHTFLYDLAIVINAWCFDGDGQLVEEKFTALLDAYQGIRPLTKNEIDALPDALRLGSIRFLMSRLEEYIKPRDEGTTLIPHNPDEYKERLLFHRQNNLSTLI